MDKLTARCRKKLIDNIWEYIWFLIDVSHPFRTLRNLRSPEEQMCKREKKGGISEERKTLRHDVYIKSLKATEGEHW